jgi:hypothetical protein
MMDDIIEMEISMVRNIVGYVISILATGMIAFGGINMIIGAEWIIKNMERIPNLGDKTMLIGFIHVIFVIIYWIPQTSNIGFFLLCSLTGGMIVSELVGGGIPIPGIMVAILLYVGAMLRNPLLSGLHL